MPERDGAVTSAKPARLDRLVEAIERQTFACSSCRAPILSVRAAERRMVTLDAAPHPKGTYVLLPPGRDGVLRCVALEKLRPADWVMAAGLDARCRHQRNCGRVVRPWWDWELSRLGARPPDEGYDRPVRLSVADLRVGDLVLSVVATVAATSPFRGPALVTGIDGSRVHFGSQVLHVGDTGRLTVLRGERSTGPVEILSKRAALAVTPPTPGPERRLELIPPPAPEPEVVEPEPAAAVVVTIEPEPEADLEPEPAIVVVTAEPEPAPGPEPAIAAAEHEPEPIPEDDVEVVGSEPAPEADDAPPVVPPPRLSSVRRTLIPSDRVLSSIADACDALGDMTRRPQPITAVAAMAIARRELTRGRPAQAFRTRDRLRIELARFGTWDVTRPGGTHPENRNERVGRLLGAGEVALSLVAALARSGDEGTDRWWFEAIDQLAHSAARPADAPRSLLDLTRAPPVLVVYAAGVAAVSAERWALVARLIGPPRHGHHDPSGVVVADLDALGLPRGPKLVKQVLESIFTEHLGLDAATYTEAWERFEYLNLRANGELQFGGTFLQPYWRTRIRAAADGRPVADEWFTHTVGTDADHPLRLAVTPTRRAPTVAPPS